MMPSGTGLEVRIDGLREQEARRMHGRKAVDQVLCETGGGGGGDERGAEKEQAGRVVSRGGSGGGEESQAHLQRRLVRGRLEQGRRQRRETSRVKPGGRMLKGEEHAGEHVCAEAQIHCK